MYKPYIYSLDLTELYILYSTLEIDATAPQILVSYIASFISQNNEIHFK